MFDRVYSGGQDKDWFVHLNKVISVIAIKFLGWRKVAQKAGECFQRGERGAELAMRKWIETEKRRAAKRRTNDARAPPTVGISTQPGGGGGTGDGREGREGGKGGRKGRGEGRPIQNTEYWVWTSSSSNLGAFQWPSHRSVKPP